MTDARKKNAARQAQWRARRNALAKRAEDLEAENARLKAQIAALKADLRAARTG